MNNAFVDLFIEQSRQIAVVTLNCDGKIVDWLPGCNAMLGYEPHEVTGCAMDFLFTPEDRARGEPQRQLQTAQADGWLDDTRWYLRKDKTQFWADGSLTALRTQGGELFGYVKLMRDRTRTRAQLDAWDNRVHNLMQRDLKRGVFIGTLAHELRNMLGPMNNAQQLLNTALGDSPNTNFPLTMISRQIKLAERLVQDLLDVTRMGAHKIRPHYSACVLGNVIKSAIEASQHFLEKRHQCVLLAAEGPIHLQADEVRLRQAFVNLISNASKFSPDKARIRIHCVREKTDAVIKISDHGRGIDSHLLPVVFETFTQADAEDNQAGLGLGLAVVKSVVEMHHGTVQAQSDGLDKGCEFIVRLPLQPTATCRSSCPKGRARSRKLSLVEL